MSIDDYLWKMLDEYDGFKHKSTLSEEELKKVMAEYAVACLHDTKLAQEALNIVGE